MRSTFGNTYMCESTYIFCDEASQIYGKNRNWMADETMHDSLRITATNTGITKGTSVRDIGAARRAYRAIPPLKFLEHIVLLCFERRFPKENSVIRLKSNILASTKCLGWQRYWSEKPRLQGTGIPLIEISNKLLLCNNLNDALTYVPFFIFRCCEPAVLYIILLEMARKLSRFVKWPVGKK